MKTEISTAVNFVTMLLKKTDVVTEDQLQQFSESLEEFLGEHYQHHWFPQTPCKGSAYRCIRINHKMDPLIGRAASTIGLGHEQLFQLLPNELTLWVDPYEVSYRIGEDGSICVLYETPPPSVKNAQCFDSRISCKEELRLGRCSPSKSYSIMTVLS